MSDVFFDDELLEIASGILMDAGFSVDALEVGDGPASAEAGFDGLAKGDEEAPPRLRLLLAHDRYFVVAVASLTTLDEAPDVDAVASTRLSRLIQESELGAKQWDVYLVLLVRQNLPEDGDVSTELIAIAHNTSFLRRIVRTGVTPNPRVIRRALAGFLPLASAERPEVVADSLTLLEEELRAQGIDETTAGRAIASFRQTGTVTGV